MIDNDTRTMRDNECVDIVYVTYNSEKWITNCFSSLMRSEYDLKKVNIYVVDNGSTDRSVSLLQDIKERICGSVGKFEIIEPKQNLGFGNGNNLGFTKGNSQLVCFFNIDTELYSDTLKQIEVAYLNSDVDIAMWELRQFPYEHPKIYDPVTMEETWSSGAAFAIRRGVYDLLNGFDKNIFMYAEDVDLSWRLRSKGYKIKYIPKARIKHYAYETMHEIKPTMYINSVINNLMLRYRYGSIGNMIGGNLSIAKVFLYREAYPGSRKELFLAYMRHFANASYFLESRCQATEQFHPQFYGFDYETNREGAFYQNEDLDEYPLVSVIVRTCGRPAILRETLCSLRNQTYPNIEIVVVEDGPDISRCLLEDEFDDLNIVYWNSGDRIGRSRNGNKGCEIASGRYLNFLDDDDLFYADHIETLVRESQRTGARAVYSYAFETPIHVISRDPYIYKVTDYLSTHKQEFDRLQLCYHNYIPIQAIMFDKSLFVENGGFDEDLDSLEDWDMWLRYATKVDFSCVKKTTSIYRTPAEKNSNADRQKALDDALQVVREKHKNYTVHMSAYECAKLYEAVYRYQIRIQGINNLIAKLKPRRTR